MLGKARRPPDQRRSGPCGRAGGSGSRGPRRGVSDKVPLEAVRRARPDIYVKGGDYRVEDLPEAKLAATWGGRTVTVTFEHERSTTALLRKVRGIS